jgi:hypothetical protein
MESKRLISLNDHFRIKSTRDMIKYANRRRESSTYQSYHNKLLAKSLECGLSRGKMTKLVDYNAYNSDDDSSIGSNELGANSNLFFHYGLASRFAESSAFKEDLPKWKNQKKNTANKKEIKVRVDQTKADEW